MSSFDDIAARRAAKAAPPAEAPSTITTPTGATGEDYTGKVYGEMDRLVRERVSRGEVPSDEMFGSAYEEARTRVGDLQPGQVDTDPYGQGARLRAQVTHDPRSLVEGSTSLPSLAAKGARALGAEDLATGIEEAEGTYFAGPWQAYERGVQEAVYVPGESGKEEARGPQTYNETSGGWGRVEQAARLGASTFVGTAAAAGLPSVDADATGEWTDLRSWEIPRLLNAVKRGWGTPEHLRLLEQGHDIVTLRHELDLGRLLQAPGTLPGMTEPVSALDVGMLGPTLVGRALEAAGVPEGANIPKKAAYLASEDMLAALAISLADVDIFMGGMLAVKGGSAVAKSALATLPAGTVARAVEPVRDAVGKMGWDLMGLDTEWGRRATAKEFRERAVALYATRDAIREAAVTSEARGRAFDAMAQSREARDALPRGLKVTMEAKERAAVAVALQPQDAVFTAAEDAARAAARVTQRGQESAAAARTLGREVVETEDLLTETRKATKKAAKAAADLVDTPEAKDAARKAARLVSPGGGLPTVGDVKATRDILGHLEDFDAARTAKVAAEAVLHDLKRRGAILSRMATDATKSATDVDLAAARGSVHDAWALLTAEKAKVLSGKGDLQAMRRASQVYTDELRKAVDTTGRRARGIIDGQIADAEKAVAAVTEEFEAARKATNEALPTEGEMRDRFNAELRKPSAAKAYSKMDEDITALTVQMKVTEDFIRGLDQYLAGTPGQEAGLAVQSLATAHAAIPLNKNTVTQMGVRATEVALEFLSQDAVARRWFGGKSEMTLEAGKHAVRIVNEILEDLTNIAKVFGDGAAEKMLDYMDGKAQVSASMRSGGYNTVGVETLWATALPVLRAMSQLESSPKVYNAIVSMFYIPGNPIEPKVHGRMREALGNLLRYGHYDPPASVTKAIPRAKDAVTRTAAAVERARIKHSKAPTPETALALDEAHSKSAVAAQRLADAEAEVLAVASMDLDTFLLRWYEASVAIQRGSPSLAAWIRYRPTTIDDITAWLDDVGRAGVDPGDMDDVLARAVEDANAPDWHGEDFIEYLGKGSQSIRNQILYAANKILADGMEGVDEVPLFERPERPGLRHLLDPNAETEAVAEGISVSDAAGIRTDVTRAIGRAFTAVGEASVIARVGQDLTAQATKAAGLNEVSLPALQALKMISEGAYSEAGSGILEAAGILNALGMRTTELKIRAVDADIKAGLEVLQDPMGGFQGFVPHALIRTMDDKLGNAVNSEEFFTSGTTTPGENYAKATAQYLVRLATTSMLWGVISPVKGIGYYTTQHTGAVTAIWGTGGAGPAAAAHVALDEYGVILGKARDAAYSVRNKMAAKLGVHVDSVLPNSMFAMTDVRVAKLYDPARAANDEMADAARGLTWGMLRAGMRKYGVVETFGTASGLLDHLRRTKAARSGALDSQSGVGQVFEGWTNRLADFHQDIEQRRRTSLFTHLVLDRGMSPERAGKIVTSAMYDWGHPMTSLESEYLMSVFMFWSFTRRAMGQAARVLVSPITEVDAAESVGSALVRSNPMMARVAGREPISLGLLMEQAKVKHAIQEQAREGDEDSDVYPWWASKSTSNFMLTNFPAPGEWVDFDKARNVTTSHLALTVPNSTPLDFANSLMHLATLSTAWLIASGDEKPGLEPLLRQLAHFGGLVTEDALKGAVDHYYGPEHPDFGANYVTVKNPADVLFFQALDMAVLGARAPGVAMGITEPWDGVFLRKDTKRGGYAVLRQAAMAKEIVPIFGSEWNTTMEPAIRAYYGTDFESAESVLQNMALMLGAYTRMGKPTAYDVPGTVATDRKYAGLETKAKARDAKRYTTPTLQERWSDPYGTRPDEPKAKKGTVGKAPSAGGSSYDEVAKRRAAKRRAAGQ